MTGCAATGSTHVTVSVSPGECVVDTFVVTLAPYGDAAIAAAMASMTTAGGDDGGRPVRLISQSTPVTTSSDAGSASRPNVNWSVPLGDDAGAHCSAKTSACRCATGTGSSYVISRTIAGRPANVSTKESVCTSGTRGVVRRTTCTSDTSGAYDTIACTSGTALPESVTLCTSVCGNAYVVTVCTCAITGDPAACTPCFAIADSRSRVAVSVDASSA